MANSAFMTMYRSEQIAAFEKKQSLLSLTTTTETMNQGNSVVFLVAGSGGAVASTRGLNGKIQGNPLDLNQYTCTLEEKHAKFEMTGFNIFSSQGNLRKAMQDGSVAVINRERDNLIRNALSGATVTTGAAATASVALISKAKTKIRNAKVGADVPLYGVITPAFYEYLMTLAQFTSADYVNDKRFEGFSKDQAFAWNGVNWIVDPELTGVGTASATCFMYAQTAIGSAANSGTMTIEMDYDKEDDYSWSRASVFMGAKLLQNSGVVKMLHDDSAFS